MHTERYPHPEKFNNRTLPLFNVFFITLLQISDMVRSLRSLPHILSFTDRPLRLIRTMAMLLLLLLLADNVAQAQVNAEVRYRTDVNGVRWSAMVDQGTCIFGWCFSITSPDPVWKVTTRDNTDGGVWYGMTDYTFYSLERSQSGGYIRPWMAD